MATVEEAPPEVVEHPKLSGRLAEINLVTPDPPDPTRPSSKSFFRIAAALSKAQGEIKEIQRTLTAHIPTKTGGYEYKYCGLDGVLSATRQAQRDNGLSLFTPLEGDKLRVFLLHVTGEWLNYGLYPLSASHQTLGSGLTYGRRYCESLVFKCAPEDDDDARAATEHYEQRAEQQPPPVKQAPRTRPRSEAPAQAPAAQPAAKPAPPKQNFAEPPGWPDTPLEKLMVYVVTLPGWPALHVACALLFGPETPVKDTTELFQLWDLFYELYVQKYEKLTPSQQRALQSTAQLVEETRARMDFDKDAMSLKQQSLEVFGVEQQIQLLKAEIDKLKKQRTAMLRGLREIAGDKCQKTTTGLGSCWHLFERNAEYTEDRWCASCTALYAIHKALGNHESKST